MSALQARLAYFLRLTNTWECNDQDLSKASHLHYLRQALTKQLGLTKRLNDFGGSALATCRRFDVLLARPKSCLDNVAVLHSELLELLQLNAIALQQLVPPLPHVSDLFVFLCKTGDNKNTHKQHMVSSRSSI